jgi:hypothetical protein
MAPTFQADERIDIMMSAAEWQLVMQTLAEGRYSIVAPLIAKLQQQMLEEAQARQSVQSLPNGGMRDASRV